MNLLQVTSKKDEIFFWALKINKIFKILKKGDYYDRSIIHG